MVLKKDKKKVLGEHFDDERIKSFLQFQAPDGTDPDFHVLEKAYRGMIAENFHTFVLFFVEAGRNINATNPQGQTILDIVRQHRHGDEYIDALIKAGAR
jgi:hypothetical protein